MDEREMADALKERGWGVVPSDQYAIDMERCFLTLWESVKPYTMTSLERGYALFKAVEYLVKNRIPGDFVECGVWRGGSSMLTALSLLEFGDDSRAIYLYDTFSGMPEPTREDVIAWNGKSVLEKLAEERKAGKDSFKSWSVGRKEVEANMRATGYPVEKIEVVEGDVCETLNPAVPGRVPEDLALLRLDTDWYASTVVELDRLYPRLVSGGILIIDDYGHFKGARKAVDAYFDKIGSHPYLSRVDYTGRVLIKP